MQDICEQYLNLVWWSQMFDTFLMQGGHSRTTGVACVVWGGRSIPGISGSLVWLLSLGAGKAVSVGRTWWHIFSYRFFSQQARRRDVCFEEWYHCITQNCLWQEYKWWTSLGLLHWHRSGSRFGGPWRLVTLENGLKAWKWYFMIWYVYMFIYIYISTYTVHV